MTPPLWLVNAALRVFVRRPLGRIGTPRELREKFRRDAKFLFRDPQGARFSRDRIDRADGAPMPALWADCGRTDGGKAILFLHGGAFLAGSPDTHRHLAAALGKAAGARALVPDYRLAPEHPFPAPVEDALCAYGHLLRTHAPENIALAGDSAGGGLVFSLILSAQEKGLPMPGAAVAFSPFADLTPDAPSLKRNARREAVLPPERVGEAVEHYLAGHDPRDPLASPVFGTFRAPPPTLLMASTTEILADHARMMADRLRDAGGDVQLEMWRGLFHAWPLLVNRMRAAGEAVAAAGHFVSTRLGAPDRPGAA